MIQYVDCLSTDIVWGQIIDSHSDVNKDIPSILVSHNLTVEFVKKIIESSVLPAAVIVENGSFAGHPSVLLNSKGVQLVVIKHLPKNYKNNFVFIDGVSEKIYFNESVQQIRHLFDSKKNKPTKSLFLPRIVKYHGDDITICVDGKNAAELELGLSLGASGVGILRTEWLGWDRLTPPTIDEHVKLYSECIKVLKGNRLNIRLFDIGGDKIPLWATSAKHEIRSPLGLRGIRSSTILSEAFDNQVKAIIKISSKTKVGIVLPMISFPEELTNFKNHLSEINSGTSPNIVWGSMCETPSAALLIREFYKLVEFIRIGPGDLSQFTLATLRENIDPNNLSGNTLNRAVIKLIKIVTTEAKKQNKEANMCLDIEPRISLIKKLLSAGIRTFNVSPLNVPKMYSLISKIK